MSSHNGTGTVVSVDAQAFKQPAEADVDDDGFPVVDETPTFAATVEQETQAKVDANHPDTTPEGLTLEAEERLEAREREIARTRRRADRRASSDREARTRVVAAEGSVVRRRRKARAWAVAGELAPWQGPVVDPREVLSQEELAAVNRQAARLAATCDGWTRPAVSRRLAERVADGMALVDAVMATLEALQRAPGTVVPIGQLEAVDRGVVSIEGQLTEVWEHDSPAIQEVGLFEDESGRTKLTIWKRSEQPWIPESERVRIHGAALNWYDGRVSLAVTGWSTIHFPERGEWWDG